MDQKLRQKLVNALTAHDIRESKKKHHNRYALALYFQALNRLENYIDAGYDVRLSMLNTFNGRLLDKLLKVAELPTSTKAESMVGSYAKLPELD